MIELLKRIYGLEPVDIQRAGEGAGSETWFVTCADGRYVVKFPAAGEMDHPENEPELCRFLENAGIPACRFVPNLQGELLSVGDDGRVFHVQCYIDGRVYELNTAPGWLMTQSAQLLGRIHTALDGYSGLPTGIGEGFFRYMTPQRALESYHSSLKHARELDDRQSVEELKYRIGLMERFPGMSFVLDRLTCRPTHGDYFISQLICGGESIKAVIDWTAACVHPAVWEIARSFVYAAPSCAGGAIDEEEFAAYVGEYLRFAPLGDYDLECIVSLFYYQIAVCDYYGQYYGSQAHNRHIFLHQARFSTALLRWLEHNWQPLTRRIVGQYSSASERNELS